MTKQYELVKKLPEQYSIRSLCSILTVFFSAFYAWRRGESHVLSAEKREKAERVKTVFETHRRRYGSRRISRDLESKGIKVGRHQVGKLMKAQSLRAIQPKSYVPRTTDSKHGLGRSSNLLREMQKAKAPNEVLVGDITYIPLTDGRFLYLATWQDMFSRRISGWDLAIHMRSELVINVLEKVIARRNCTSGLICHSDGGGQYASHELKKLLKKHGFLSSMTRKDNHYDNAMAESLFSRFKAELMEKGAFENFDDAYTEIFEYIEIYYNTQRIHSGIKYQTPDQFEKAWEKSQNCQ